MEVKGVSVRSVLDYVKKRHPEEYNKWFEAMPDKSRSIYSDLIRANEWYPLTSGLTQPMRTIGTVFYNGELKKAVWEMGRFSAEDALTGIYKLYMKMGSPKHIIDRASRIMSAYFNPSEMKVITAGKNSITLHITRFDEPDEAIEYNIGGWIERALEISGCTSVEVRITQSLARKDKVTEYVINFN
jgi:uncharacterized protein (TIGR02265 family)